MTLDEHFQWREDDTPSARMRGAAMLLASPDAIALNELMYAIEREPVRQVRNVLSKVLAMRMSDSPERPLNQSDGTDESELAEILRRTLDDLGDLISHEVAPPLGWLEVAANEEVPNFTSSVTARELAALRRRLEGLTTLVRAHRPIDMVEVDLQGLFDKLLTHHRESEVAISLEAVNPPIAPVLGDANLLELLLSNALRNAFDAAGRVHGASLIQVQYGVTITGLYWISIVNHFDGSSFAFEEVSATGISSKGAARGYGVKVMQLVASRMNLEIQLIGRDGVAQFIVKQKAEGP